VSSSPGPREGGPRRRRAFTARGKLDHLTACGAGDGGSGVYLREQGIYSSQITEWRELRDAGVLADKKPGEKVGRPSPEQAEIARLTRELELPRRRLGETRSSTGHYGKAHAYAGHIPDRGAPMTPRIARLPDGTSAAARSANAANPSGGSSVRTGSVSRSACGATSDRDSTVGLDPRRRPLRHDRPQCRQGSA